MPLLDFKFYLREKLEPSLTSLSRLTDIEASELLDLCDCAGLHCAVTMESNRIPLTTSSRAPGGISCVEDT